MNASSTGSAEARSDELRRFLQTLYGAARPELVVELRLREGSGMRQRIVPVSRLDLVEEIALAQGRRTDVYVSVLPRWRARGARRDVAGGARVAWVDCDGEQSIQALSGFAMPPSAVVRSGTGDNCHAYWLLDRSATVAEVQRANRRLAFALGADPGSADAARILRPLSVGDHVSRRFVPARSFADASVAVGRAARRDGSHRWCASLGVPLACPELEGSDDDRNDRCWCCAALPCGALWVGVGELVR